MFNTRIGRPLAASLIVTLGSVVSTLALAQVATQVPTIINLYPNAGLTADQARAAVREANAIFRQANIELVVARVNTIAANTGGANQFGGDNGGGGGTAGDGIFTRAERDAARTFGGNELRGLANMRGIKLSFGRQPEAADATNPGVSIHRDPTAIVQARQMNGQFNAALTGATIAHELGHIMTLDAAHVIDGANGVRADNNGHAPNVAGGTGNGNAMAPSNRRNGTNLTGDQVTEIQRNRLTFGKNAERRDASTSQTKVQEQFGGVTGQNPAPSLFNIGQINLTSILASDLLTAQFTANGIPPSAGSVNAVYTLGFDTDASSATGLTYAGLDGVDRIATIRLSGDPSLGSLSAAATLTDTVLGTTVPLATPLVEIENEQSDLDVAGSPGALSTLLDISKLLLGPLADHVPVVGTAGDGSSIFDTQPFVFDAIRWLEDPTLLEAGNGVPTPGAPYLFSVLGLQPFDTFNLFLDDDVVFSGLLDATGSFSGSFVFPTSVPIDQLHFLTAQDSTGEFAYSFTSPFAVPEPPTLVLLFAGTLMFLIPRTRDRRAQG